MSSPYSPGTFLYCNKRRPATPGAPSRVRSAGFPRYGALVGPDSRSPGGGER